MFDAPRDRLPFQPIRETVYRSAELMAGFTPRDPHSLMRSLDFESFYYFVVNGRTAPHNKEAARLQALHDTSILGAMWAHVAAARRPVAAMLGGHGEQRGSATYLEVASIAQRLTEEGFLMASGGGPGCMEATHLGALLAGRAGAELADAVGLLSEVPKLPDAHDLVRHDGGVDLDLVAALHGWAAPAVKLMKDFESIGSDSLAIPTWHYGHEPTSPLATHVAKYFCNSIREDALLGVAAGGVVFSPGRAGTLQEVFQAAAHSYYDHAFVPMVFWDEQFWTEQLPVRPLLEGLFVKLNGMSKQAFDAKVLVTSDIDEAVAFMKQSSRRTSPTIDGSRPMAATTGDAGTRPSRQAGDRGPSPAWRAQASIVSGSPPAALS
jgi:predicted Rossmann-fold nucleotide-binding protein